MTRTTARQADRPPAATPTAATLDGMRVAIRRRDLKLGDVILDHNGRPYFRVRTVMAASRPNQFVIIGDQLMKGPQTAGHGDTLLPVVRPTVETVTWTFPTTPVHPGELLWSEWLEPLNLTVGRAAKGLGVSRKTLSAIINGRQAITADMSVRLGMALGTPEDAWFHKQGEFEMAEVDRSQLHVKRLTPDGIQLDVD